MGCLCSNRRWATCEIRGDWFFAFGNKAADEYHPSFYDLVKYGDEFSQGGGFDRVTRSFFLPIETRSPGSVVRSVTFFAALLILTELNIRTFLVLNNEVK